jgi:hypothetical protein
MAKSSWIPREVPYVCATKIAAVLWYMAVPSRFRIVARGKKYRDILVSISRVFSATFIKLGRVAALKSEISWFQ